MKRATRQHGTPSKRFWPKVDKSTEEDGCWLWTASKNPDGYGQFRGGKGASVFAHRWAYENANGPVPDGLELDHLCRDRACVRPDHLEPVTQAENVRRGLRGVLCTHCKHGHPLSGDNLRINPKDGHRMCRACDVVRNKAYRTKRKEGTA